jgi:carbamoyltransferase
MILVAPTRLEWREKIPAVVHRDGSARVQTVHRELTPRYYALHVEVKKRTGIPVLLNTSLNRRGIPIVERPEEAIALFLETALDALVIENWVLSKRARVDAGKPPPSNRDIPRSFANIAAALQNGAPSPGFGAVQFVVNGPEDRFTLQLTGRATLIRGPYPAPPLTFTLSQDAMREILDRPQAIRELLQAPGLSSAETQTLADRVGALLSLAGPATDQ